MKAYPMPADTMTDNKTRTKVKPKLDLVPPPLFSVIFLNDSTTTMDFVVACLMEIFNHSEEDAQALCLKVHQEGSAVVAVLPYELAEQKGVEATVMARNNNFPLMVRLEPES